MRLGLISDTHGDAAAIRKAVCAAGPVDGWLHAGDFFQDGSILAQLTGLPVTAVRGNCDLTANAKIDEFITVADTKIWLTHGHRYGVLDGEAELVAWGMQFGVDIIVYGHTHIAHVTQAGSMWVINPGSPSRPKAQHPPSCAIIKIQQQIEAEIIWINS